MVIKGLRNKVVKGELIAVDNKGDRFYNQSSVVYESERSVVGGGGGVRIRFNQFEYDPKNVSS